MLRDVNEAEDATQQTFLSAHRALLGGVQVREEGAWLATIARNECRARISAGMRSPLPIPDEDLAAIPTTRDEVERSAEIDALRTAFAELPERQREAVVLRDLYGLPAGEVATALGLSRPATEALLFRARRTLRRQLRPLVATTLVVPISIQEGLAQAIPGFGVAGPGGVAAGAAGGGLLAKLAAGSVGVKVATTTVAVTTVGAVGSVETERPDRDRGERPAIVAVDAPTRGQSSGSDSRGPGLSSSGRSGSGGEGSDDRNSGPGSVDTSGRDDDRSDDRSGSDSTSSGSSSETKGSSARSGSGSSGSGRSGGSESDDNSGSAHEARSIPSASTSSGSSSGSRADVETAAAEPESSGSGSSGSGGDSSGTGSGDDDQDVDD